MKNKNMFIEIESHQIFKHGEEIAGDNVGSQKFQEGNRIITVLSDGLGSGVKANILSNMTVQMGLKFIGSDSDILHSSEMMMDALPTCQIRKISYSTFTIVDNTSSGTTKIIEMDNPPCIYIRDGAELKLPFKTVYSPKHKNRKIHLMEIKPRPEDRLIIFSDGISQTGHGSKEFKLGWKREGCLQYVIETLKENPMISSRDLSRLIVETARNKSINKQAHDDMTATVFYYRKPRRLLVLTGPPFNENNDSFYANTLKNFDGKRVVCGGTTSKIISRELNAPVTYDIKIRDKETPPISKSSYTDLITEGILTLTKCSNLLQKKEVPLKKTGATLLTEIMLNSDDITFMVGTRINEAHQDPTLPIDLEIRRNIVKKIANILKTNHLKEVKIEYI